MQIMGIGKPSFFLSHDADGGSSRPASSEGGRLLFNASTLPTRDERTAAASLSSSGLTTGVDLSAISPNHKAELDYRAATLYASDDIGGRSYAITPGVSATPARSDLNVRRPGPARVLILAHFPLGSNGSGMWTKAIAKELTSQGAEVRILHNGHDFDRPGVGEYLVPFTSAKKPALTGAAQADLPIFDSNPSSTGKRFKHMSEAEIKAYAEGFADAVAVANQEFDADIVIVNHNWTGTLAAARTGLPYVTVGHGTCSKTMGKALKDGDYPAIYAEMILPRVLAAARTIAVSDPEAEEVKNVFGVSASKTICVYNGFDDSKFYPRTGLDRASVLRDLGVDLPADTKSVVVYAGRMAPHKGVTDLLQAIQFLRHGGQLLQTHFVLAGNGQKQEEYIGFAEQLGLQGAVTFIGQRNHDELALLFNVADLGVIPSLHEAFGIIALEITGSGTPIVASDVGGLGTIVTEEMGRKVQPGDVSELAATIYYMLQTEAKKRLGADASKYIHGRFPWSICGEKVRQILNEVLAEDGLSERLNRLPI